MIGLTLVTSVVVDIAVDRRTVRKRRQTVTKGF